MLTTFNWERGSGKTKRAIELLENDDSLFLIIRAKSHLEFYPIHMHSRIIHIKANDRWEYQLLSKQVKKVVLDEAFGYPKDFIAKLFYTLGNNKIDVLAFGTDPDPIK